MVLSFDNWSIDGVRYRGLKGVNFSRFREEIEFGDFKIIRLIKFELRVFRIKLIYKMYGVEVEYFYGKYYFCVVIMDRYGV